MSYTPVTPISTRFKPGVSGNPSGLPKNFRFPTHALRHLLRIRGQSVEEVATRFRAARGRAMCGADHLAVTTYLKACDPEARGGEAAFREILDRVEGPVVRDVKVRGEAQITVHVVPLDELLEGPRADAEVRRMALHEAALEADRRRKALQDAAIEAAVVDPDESDGSADDSGPNETDDV